MPNQKISIPTLDFFLFCFVLLANFFIFYKLNIVQLSDVLENNNGDNFLKLRYIFISVEIIVFLFCLFNFPYIFKSSLNICLLALACTITVSSLININSRNEILQAIVINCYWIFIYFFFYILTEKYPSWFYRYIWVFCTLMLIELFFVTRSVYTVSSENMELHNTFIYFPLFLSAWVFFINRFSLKILLHILLFAGLLIALKRGAVLAYLIALFMIFISKSSNARFGMTLKICTTLVVIVFALYFVTSVNEQVQKNQERFESIEMDEGSGRLNIYRTYFKDISEPRILSKIMTFGNGPDSYYKQANIWAHNDWFEYLYDYGIIGVLLFLGIHLCLIKQFFRFYRNSQTFSSSFIYVYTIFLLSTMYSQIAAQPTTWIVNLFTFFGIMECYAVNKTSITTWQIIPSTESQQSSAKRRSRESSSNLSHTSVHHSSRRSSGTSSHRSAHSSRHHSHSSHSEMSHPKESSAENSTDTP